MNDNDAVLLFKCLSDKSRLQILKSLAIEDMYVERLAQRLGLTPATVSFHLKKLSDAGAVSSCKSQYYTMYTLNRSVFAVSILDILCQPSDDSLSQRDAEYRQKVLDTFFRYGKLVSIPAQRKKERIILEKLAESFQSGRLYTEREVNLILADYHDDFCTLRRDMIAEGLMRWDEKGYVRVV